MVNKRAEPNAAARPVNAEGGPPPGAPAIAVDPAPPQC